MIIQQVMNVNKSLFKYQKLFLWVSYIDLESIIQLSRTINKANGKDE